MITSSISPALKVGLRFLGMWPGDSYSTIHWLSFMLSMLILQYFQYLYIFGHLKMSELSNLVDGLIVALDYSLTLFKLTSLWAYRRIFHQLLVAMDNDWHECINNDQHLYLMIIKANISHLVCNAILSIIAVGSVVYLLGDYVLHVSGQIDIMCYEFGRISNKSVFHHKSIVSLFGTLIERHNRIISFSEKIEELFSFIALMQVVWNTLVIGSLGFFMIISIHNETVIFVLIKTIVGYLGIMAEAFIICFAGEYLSLKVLHISGQIDILCQEFKTISAKALPDKTSTSTLGILIERHNRVFWFSDNIENLFSFIALMQVIWNTLVICSLGFIIIISELIADAAYESFWYDLSLNQKRILMFIIMRSQKQLMITAGRITSLSLSTFTSYYQYRYVFEHFNISELSNLVDSLTAALAFSLIILKVTSIWMHRGVLHQLLAAMDNDWRKCVEIDQHLNVMTIKANISHFYSSVMVSINILAAISYSLGGYAISFVYLPGDHNNTLRQFPIKVQFPLTTQQSPIFELLAVTQFLLILFNSYMLSIITALISTLIKIKIWFVILKSQKQLIITAGKITNLSLETFTITSTVSPVLKIGLQMFGVWPEVSQSIPYWLLYIFSILIVQYFQYRYVYEHFKISELSNLVDSLPAALDYSLTILKVTSLWIHRRVIHQLLTAMDKDWQECVNIDQHLYVMTVKARGYSNDTLRQLPIKVQFPFETQQSPIFELLVIILFLHVMLNSCTISILNALISTLSKSIANAAYESLWYDLLANQKKTITFIIMRAQKQVMITAGRITNLSLETFTSVSSYILLIA
ncbi:PREDICTED: uncharacterized protein LOC108778724 [Cyphomyrmex costatus]|uniref:uncharacterized protein LOC108778724 n=1 Tax=Cyphomyrmex costatus TaxID=456900 RepID=UPI000852315D|nr:PREDICTED: uncharacterized protein LOC108778724 [Cyphomyrmex costatus]